MAIFLTLVHVVVCLFLIIVVLLQSGKAADLAGAFGGMGSQTAFGPRGAATMLSKATTFAAVLFMVTSIWLGIQRTSQGGTGDSVIERTGTGQQAPAPEAATPEQPAAPPAEQGQSNPFESITVETEKTSESDSGASSEPTK